MSKLKGKDPKTTEPSKPKAVIYSASGIGKTWWALSFPNVYYIDTEGGATRGHYMDRLKEAGGLYLGAKDGANDFEEVINQFKALATEKHAFKTVVIDSISKLFNSAVANEAERLGDKNAFGADKKPAIQFMRRLVNQINRLDMNVLLVAHEKAEWGLDAKGDRVELGKTPDCWDKLIYELDLAFHAQKRGSSRVAVTKKSRLIGFPENESFPLTFEDFASRYGKEVIVRESKQVVVSTAEQVSEINRLVDLLKIDTETSGKWLDKAGAETFAEFTEEQASKIIESLKKKLG